MRWRKCDSVNGWYYAFHIRRDWCVSQLLRAATVCPFSLPLSLCIRCCHEDTHAVAWCSFIYFSRKHKVNHMRDASCCIKSTRCYVQVYQMSKWCTLDAVAAAAAAVEARIIPLPTRSLVTLVTSTFLFAIFISSLTILSLSFSFLHKTLRTDPESIVLAKVTVCVSFCWSDAIGTSTGKNQTPPNSSL